MKANGLTAWVLLLLIGSAAVLAADESELSGEITLFGNSSGPPIQLDSERGWIPVGAVDLSEAILNHPSYGDRVKWRLRTSYRHDFSTGPATLQIRLRGSGSVPTFTHPWSEGAYTPEPSFSNWYEDAVASPAEDNMGYIEARLIAPPRTPLTGKLFSIVLETWTETRPGRSASPSGSLPDVNLAYTRPLPTAPIRSPEKGGAPHRGDDSASPLDFALSFVEACLTGDLPSYYRLHSDPVRSLDTGLAMAKYRLNPPRAIPGISSMEDYKRRFDYKIYDYSTFGKLFPEWFDGSRPWKPSEKSLLFMGHRDRLNAGLPESIDYLVFLVEPDSAGNWFVAARPGE